MHRCAEHGSLRALEKITAKRERLTSKEWALDIDKGGVDVSYRMSKVLEVDRHSFTSYQSNSDPCILKLDPLFEDYRWSSMIGKY